MDNETVIYTPQEFMELLNDYFPDLDRPQLTVYSEEGDFDIEFRRSDADTEAVPDRLEFPPVIVQYRKWDYIPCSNHEWVDVHCTEFYSTLKRPTLHPLRGRPRYPDSIHHS